MNRENWLVFILFIIFSQCFVLSKCELLAIDVNDNATTLMDYIVHVYPPSHHNDSKLVSAKELEDWHMSFLPNTTLDTGEPRLLFSYHHVIGGFAARLTPREVEEMRKIEGFVSAEVSKNLSLASTYLPTFLELDNYQNSIWQLSKQGEGVIIGVLDTGIVASHPSFDDKGMPAPPINWRGCCELNGKQCDHFTGGPCNNKLIGAISVAKPGDPYDTEGHGTMCASLAAGNPVEDAEFLGQAKGTAMGVAPRAHIASYKVCSPSCKDTYVLKGIEQAILDGVHVISISIFSGGAFYDNPNAKGLFSAVDQKGILPVACAGNVGSMGITNCIENDAPWILTVGASSIDRSIRATLKLGNGMEFDGEMAYQPANWNDTIMRPIVFPGVSTIDQDLSCTRRVLSKFDIKGKLVACVYDGFQGMDVQKREELVKELGGDGLIIINLQARGGTVIALPNYVVPAVYINHADALKMQSYYQTESNPVATIIFKGTLYHTPRAPAVASFSCRGPSRRSGGILKPDIIAPGLNLLTAWHEQLGPNKTKTDKIFSFEFGTSAATPVAAGVAALLKGIHPDWSPAAIKSAIMTTAHIKDKTGMPIYDHLSKTEEPASFFAMGAGHVNPPKAVDPGLVYNTTIDDYLAYLCGLGYNYGQIFQTTRRKVRCSEIKNLKPEELNYPSIAVYGLNAQKKFIVPRNVTNVGEPNSKYAVEIKEPDGVNISVNPPTLEFNNNVKELSFEVKISGKANNGKQRGSYSEGHIIWKDGKHSVRSPVLVGF